MTAAGPVPGAESAIGGFRWVACGAGYSGWELQYELAGGGFYRVSKSSEAEALQAAASWLEAQSRRKDGGALAGSRPPVRVGLGAAVAEPGPRPHEPEAAPDDDDDLRAA